MLKKIILGGMAASAIGFHSIDNKQSKEKLKKYCPVLTKCIQKSINKSNKSNKSS